MRRVSNLLFFCKNYKRYLKHKQIIIRFKVDDIELGKGSNFVPDELAALGTTIEIYQRGAIRLFTKRDPFQNFLLRKNIGKL